MDLKAILASIISWATNLGIKIVISLLILAVTFRIINRISRKIEKKGSSERHDKTIMKVLSYIVKIGAKVMVIICLIGYLGIDTTGLTALLVSAGAAIGLALNGALGNLAGGIIIIFTRPFRIDDFIEAQGVSGTVEDIHIVCTKVRTPDNKVVYIPNGALSGGNIINYSEKETRRVDVKFDISYDADAAKATELIRSVVESNELVLSDPEIYCKVTEYADSAVIITARAWVKNSDYWTVHNYILNEGKAALDKAGIEIPFNQLEVTIKNPK